MTDFQTLVRQELGDEPPPPRDIAAAALKAGRGARRRRWAVASGAAAVLALAAIALPVLLPWSAWRLADQAGAARDVPVSGPLVPATPAGALEALRYLLPPGQPGRYSGEWSDPRQFTVRTEQTTAHGPGTVALNITHQPGEYDMFVRADPCHGALPVSSCTRTTLADGTVVTLLHMTGNCDESTVVSVLRSTDTQVTLSQSTCGGAGALLSDAQAVAIAANPVFAWQMPTSLVDAGARDFGDLPGAPR
jgi:hypothetical protein